MLVTWLKMCRKGKLPVSFQHYGLERAAAVGCGGLTDPLSTVVQKQCLARVAFTIASEHLEGFNPFLTH